MTLVHIYTENVKFYKTDTITDMSFTKNIKHLVLLVAILFGSLSVMLLQASANVSAQINCEAVVGDAAQQECLDAAAAAAANPVDCEKVVGDADQQACLDAAAAAAADAGSGSSDIEFSNSYETYNDGENPIYIRLNQIITFLSVGIGVVVAVSSVFAGIQWTISRGDPQGRAKAVKRITDAGIAVLLYVFGFALLNWLIPGGPF